MGPHSTDEYAATQTRAELAGLLEIAGARLRRQKSYVRTLSKGARRSANMEAILMRAHACIAQLAKPQAVLMPVQAKAMKNGICIENRVDLEGKDLAREIADGGKITAYLLTLGYDQQCAFEWLGGDYVIHHVQSDLSSEVLFALGRQVFQTQRDLLPADARLRRIPVQAGSHCAQRRYWDPNKVQALVQVFGSANPGVVVTDTGCFKPLNSLLGLTITL